MVRTYRKINRFFIYKSLPFLLCLLTVFSFSFRGGFSASPARAVAGVDDVIIGGTIIAWLTGMGISLSNQLGNDSGLKDTLIDGLKSICSGFDTFKNQVQGWCWSQIYGAINDISVVVSESGQKFLEIGSSVAPGLIGNVLGPLGLYITDTYSLVDNMTSPEVIYTSPSGYRFADGTSIDLFVDSNNLGTRFYMNESYQLYGGSILNFVKTVSNAGYLKSVYKDGTLMTSSDSSYDSLFCVFRQSGTSGSVRFYHLDGNGNPYYEFNKSISGGVSTYLGDPLASSILATGRDTWGDIEIPESGEAGYVSIPNSVTGSLPANPTLDDYLGGVLDDALTGVTTNIGTMSDAYVIELSDAIPVPPESQDPDITGVELPLIGIILPSNFTLALSSIWHYVRTWVQSIASWFGWMFGIFSSLPYAMVVPIYASAVIVIVLGMYKRFFM